MDARRTPERPVSGIPRHTPDPTLERGFVASLRWLVAEGDARGVRRIAVELRALREALTTLDETRRARDEYAERAAELEKEIQGALELLGDATKVDGNGSLVARLTRGEFPVRSVVRVDQKNGWVYFYAHGDAARVYGERFTATELNEMIRFYGSPTGRKVLSLENELTDEVDGRIGEALGGERLEKFIARVDQALGTEFGLGAGQGS